MSALTPEQECARLERELANLVGTGLDASAAWNALRDHCVRHGLRAIIAASELPRDAA